MKRAKLLFVIVAVLITACANKSLAQQLRERGNRGRTAEEHAYIETMFTTVENSEHVIELAASAIDGVERNGPNPDAAAKLKALPNIPELLAQGPDGFYKLNFAFLAYAVNASAIKKQCTEAFEVASTGSIQSCRLFLSMAGTPDTIIAEYDRLFPR